MATEQDDVSNRRDPRDSVFLNATVRTGHGEGGCLIRVRNISSSGLMADSPVMFGAGDELDVELRNIGTVHGRVVWASSGRFGMIFDRAIDPQLARTPVGGKGGQSPFRQSTH
ncbi:MAG: PilZ domain-containing protein [Sphingomonadaceae bacterium]